MTAYNYKILDFLGTKNTVLITNKKDFDSFKNILTKLGLNDILTFQTYEEWQRIAKINHCEPNMLCFEYDNARGLILYNDYIASEKWYGVKPFLIKDLVNKGEWSHD